jgi:biotin transport system substrate-specific component
MTSPRVAAPAVPAPLTLANLIPAGRVRTVALVVGVAALTALAARVAVPLPGTPVPVSLQTAAVLVGGAALGWRAGLAAQVLYLAVGVAGLPVYSGGASGWAALTGANGGYLVGFAVAAALVGAVAERGGDRDVRTAVPAMALGTAAVYLCGASWLAASLDLGAGEALRLGVVPFLVGDVLKVVAGGLALPLAWRLAR